MPRPIRIAPAGVCFHVLNRGNNRQPLFRKEGDYLAFLEIVTTALQRFEIDLFSWCLMPNHWHLALRPRKDSALSQFMAWLSITHVRRHHAHYPSASGHLYQGRYKSFPVETDEYFLNLCRYVEGNPLRAKLVERAEDWMWSSLRRGQSDAEPTLTEWPVDRPRGWVRIVNESMAKEQLEQIGASLRRDCPLGSERWSKTIAQRLRLQQTIEPIGRPRKPLKTLAIRQRQRRAKERQIGA